MRLQIRMLMGKGLTEAQARLCAELIWGARIG